MHIVQKAIRLSKPDYYEKHLLIINNVLPVQMTPKEAKVLAAFISLEGDISDNPFGTTGRKIVRERLGLSSGGLGNFLDQLKKKGFIREGEDKKITILPVLIPSDDGVQGYQFKLEIYDEVVHPQDLISRMFMLDYLREIDVELAHSKGDYNEKKKLFYRYEYEVDGEIKSKYEYNWEELLFNFELAELETFMEKFLPEIEKIDAEREVIMKMKMEELNERQSVADINIMDLAQTAINKASDPTYIHGTE